MDEPNSKHENSVNIDTLCEFNRRHLHIYSVHLFLSYLPLASLPRSPHRIACHFNKIYIFHFPSIQPTVLVSVSITFLFFGSFYFCFVSVVKKIYSKIDCAEVSSGNNTKFFICESIAPLKIPARGSSCVTQVFT